MKLRYSERANIAFRHRGNFGIASYGRYGYWEKPWSGRRTSPKSVHLAIQTSRAPHPCTARGS